MTKNNERAGSEQKNANYDFTEQELDLGRKAAKFVNVLCMVALIASILVVVFVFMSVPANTRIPYAGRWATGPLPMQIVMLLSPAFLFMIWRDGRKSDAHHMTNRGRIGWYFLGPAMIAACVAGQLVLAKAALTAGGFFAGWGIEVGNA
ncbi:hypothetical protein ACIPVK_09500 [Paeniglutamicibacter sp. MACA_103]|uniref:hypothetical protein n=1 Tax=Paeniglutamicibacter sp. MACA_103 TaxID=3377337 RepID=UPI0038952F25